MGGDFRAQQPSPSAHRDRRRVVGDLARQRVGRREQLVRLVHAVHQAAGERFLGALAIGTASLGGDLVVIANRFAGQAENGAAGVRVETHLPGPRVLAADNWWGCNGGPGTPGCDAVQRLDVQPPS